MTSSHSTLRHGVVAGLIGAGSVALWYLILDLAHGRPFYTPAALGSAALLGARSVDAVSFSPWVIIAYTIFHIAAFMIAGIAASKLLGRAETTSGTLVGVVLLFVTFQVFMIGLLAIAAAWLLAVMPWWTIVVANLIAATAMGVYLWHAYPGLREQLDRGDDDLSVGTRI